MTSEEIVKKITVKLNMLQLMETNLLDVLERRQSNEIKKNINLTEKRLDELRELKDHAQELMLEEEEEMEKVNNWGKEVESKIISYEEMKTEMEASLEKLSFVKDDDTKRREEELQKEKLEKKIAEEVKIEEARQKKRLEYERKLTEEQAKQERDKEIKVKLPKLEITKFNGTHLDWVRFWSQFEVEIDKSNLPAVTKFSYLKELVIPKVRASINGLPFTTEGYNRARNILHTKFGETSEVSNAHIQSIMTLPSIPNTNIARIHDFYERLSTNVNALDTLGKLKEINGYVRLTLDKLSGIRADLVRTDDNWKNWKFFELIEALRKWTERNPIAPHFEHQKENIKKDRLLQTTGKEKKKAACIYCDNEQHKSYQCEKVKTLGERKKIIATKRLCYNCTGTGHRAADCKSKRNCQNCGGRHHSSICDKNSTTDLQQSTATVLATTEVSVVYPTVLVQVNGITCRALLDTGAGSSYASATLIERINQEPVRKDYKRIEMMLHTTTKAIDIFQVQVSSLDGKFKITTEINKVEKSTLLLLPNPKYEELLKRYNHLKNIKLEDKDTKELLPIHLILGASDYSKVKTRTAPKIGNIGEPIAELTSFGWTIISSGDENDFTNLYLTQSSAADYEQLCKLDVLGLQDPGSEIDDLVYQRFKNQLKRNENGCYETGLLWKQDQKYQLGNNKAGSIARLNNLIKKLQKDEKLFNKYDEIIQDQIKSGVVEIAPEEPQGQEFYLPHHPVIRENAESTKVRVVYDGSAKASNSTISLNDCLETGPPLQNKIWDILLRNRFNPIALSGDMKSAFLQIRIREKDRDCLRFHWILNKDPSLLQRLRFTRAIWGLVESPFLLNGTIKIHLETRKEEFQEQIKQLEEIEKDIYVDDLVTGGCTVEEVSQLKTITIATFQDAGFELHKWNSNRRQLEDPSVINQADGNNQTYAKQQLGVKPNETKLLGMHWDKNRDVVSVSIPRKKDDTKRGILRFLASIFDPLGIISPITLCGKILYRESCDLKIGWDKPITNDLLKKWTKWVSQLPEKIEVPRSITTLEETIEEIDLHVFGDASKDGVSAVLYGVTYQPSGVNQMLISSKSRLSKKDLSIPRLELVAAHMAANLLDNARAALKTYSIKNCVAWTDSTVVLHWIRSEGNYKQFVSNRVSKIKSKKEISWRYVPTKENPADIGSRGCMVKDLKENWFNGPCWLTNQEEWPKDITTLPSPETESEAKIIKEVFAATVVQNDNFSLLIKKFSFQKATRITAWLLRFSNNSLKQKQQRSGPLTTEELEESTTTWIKRIQNEHSKDTKVEDDKARLLLEENQSGILVCKGRMQGDHPIYIPPDNDFAEKLVMNAHLKTLHGGVTSTMTHIREKYWIPRLRQLVKRVRKSCYGCKRFQTVAFNTPPPGLLPRDRTEGFRAFQIVGTDYAGPIIYKKKQRIEGKAYILLFACSLSRAVHIELLTDQTTEGFIQCLKRFIGRRGRPEKIYSDNAKTFEAAAKWLKKVMASERFHEYLTNQEIKWQFNLSRAPWWGGQYERIIGVLKQSMYKTIGKTTLTFNELEEVLLDVEQTLNNRPLTYVEDDVEFPTLTPNSLIFGIQNHIPTMEKYDIVDKDLRKRAKYVQSCKNAAWSRWSNEYIKALRERHNLKHHHKINSIKTGDVVLIKGDNKNRGKWNIGIVTDLYPGIDGEIRAVKLRVGNKVYERAIQQLYPMELSCNLEGRDQHEKELNADAEEFRPKRNAAAIANVRIEDQAEDERLEE